MISVIIPTKDGGDDLSRCLQGLTTQTIGDVEIIVVDSGSRDESIELARSHGARVLEIAPSRFRHGATRNFAAEQAKGEVLVFTTQDAVADSKHWLERLCGPLEGDQELAGVYGRQVAHENAAPPERFFLEFVYGPHARIQQAQSVGDLTLNTTLFSNANSAIRRSVWERYPFSEDIFFGEDQDWARRVLLAGYALRYEPDAVVRHSHSYTLSEAFRRFFDTGVSGERGFLAGSASSSFLVRQALRYAHEEAAWLVKTGQRRWIPYTALYELAKFAGLQMGARHRVLPLWLKRRCSSLPDAWPGQ